MCWTDKRKYKEKKEQTEKKIFEPSASLHIYFLLFVHNILKIILLKYFSKVVELKNIENMLL
jgi:hypothetical protein